jgi:site-specific recombinase XerD
MEDTFVPAATGIPSSAIEVVSSDPRPLVPAALLPPDQQPALIYLARLAPGSRRTMRTALTTIAGLLTDGRGDLEQLAWAALRYQHTQALRAVLAARYAPATANKLLAALRGVLRETWQLGQMSAEDYHRAANVQTVRGSTLPRGRALQPGELRALFQVCAIDPSPAGVRDAALLAVLYGGGLRRSEVVGLDVADYDPAADSLTIRVGKGNKARLGYTAEGSQPKLQAWLAVRGSAAGALFCPIRKDGTLVVRAMSADAVRKLLRKRAKEAGVAAFSPHDLRRTMISDLLDAGADLSTVQQLAGHAQVQTTARYDRRGETAKRKAAKLLHMPQT